MSKRAGGHPEPVDPYVSRNKHGKKLKGIEETRNLPLLGPRLRAFA